MQVNLRIPNYVLKVMGITARTAMKIGKMDEAAKVISGIPVTRLQGGLATVAIQIKMETGDKEGAFELAKTVLTRDWHPSIIEQAIELSKEIGRQAELEEVIRNNPEIENMATRNPEVLWELERHGFDFSELRERSSAARRAPSALINESL